jgi:hypothetical protein
MRRPIGTRRLGQLGAAVMVVLVVVGCSATTSTPSDGAFSSTPADPSLAPATSSSAIPQESSTSSGVRELTCHLIGGPGPQFVVEVPAGWVSLEDDCGFVIPVPDPGVFTAGLSGWIVGQVPTHPCQNHATLTSSGETVDELVQALVTQELRNATAPVDVTLAGYEGTYLEWSVPTDIVVLDDEYHVEGCDDGNFLSWLGRTGGTRYQQVGGQIDQLWILDVDGRTVVIDASYAPDAPQRIRDELAAIVQTLEFVTR